MNAGRPTPPPRPGIGTHGAILARLLRALSAGQADSGLAALTTREGSDPTIALLDAWAVIADVVSFYSTRIAAEGYLPSATERRSLVELARLAGYQPSPGAGASTHLAYLLTEVPDPDAETVIAAGSRSQSVPGPGERPQTFETTNDLAARGAWNRLRPQLTLPPAITRDTSCFAVEGVASGLKANDVLLLSAADESRTVRRVAAVEPDLASTTTLVTLTDAAPAGAGPLEAARTPVATPARAPGAAKRFEELGPVVQMLSVPPSRPPASPRLLDRDPAALFAPGSDLAPQMLTALNPILDGALAEAWSRMLLGTAGEVTAFRSSAMPFGATAPQKPVVVNNALDHFEEWHRVDALQVSVAVLVVRNAPDFEVRFSDGPGTATATGALTTTVVPLAGGTVNIAVGTVTSRTAIPPTTFTVGGGLPAVLVEVTQVGAGLQVQIDGTIVGTVAPGTTQRGVTGGRQFLLTGVSPPPAPASDGPTATTPLPTSGVRVEIGPGTPTLTLDSRHDNVPVGDFVVVKQEGIPDYYIGKVQGTDTVAIAGYGIAASVTRLTLDPPWPAPPDLTLAGVRAVSVYLSVTRLPLARALATDDVAGVTIELDALYFGLQPGRLIIVEGERTDIPGVRGVRASELAMLANITHATASPADFVHTTLHLTTPVAYRYNRATVTIWGNVTAAGHGASRSDVLGTGDASQPLQSFVLPAFPLTFIASATPRGVTGTLTVTVDGVRWTETDTFVGLSPTDLAYITHTDDTGTTTVTFGDGTHGSRPPTGATIRAIYRVGMGGGGNLPPGRISQLTTRPLGVIGVSNPVPASGGADPESADQIRRNVATEILTFDRLVSVRDYEDFARARPGIAKASSRRLSDGGRQLVHVTVAGAGGQPLDDQGETLRSLRSAVRRNGDPVQPVLIAPARLMLLIVSARIRPLPGGQWEDLEPRVRSTLLETFGFAQRELGQDVSLGEIYRATQQVPGVDEVHVETLGEVPAGIEPADFGRLANGLRPPAPRRVVSGQASLANKTLTAAGVLWLSPDIPDTLVLKEAK